MKNKSLIIGLMLILALMLCGCGCKHEWSEATCESPRTCANCDAVEGEALGHDWLDATCESPKTCARCGISEGEATEHSFGLWSVYGEEMSRECDVCGEKEKMPVDRESMMKSLLAGKWDFEQQISSLNLGISSLQLVHTNHFADNQPVNYLVFDSEGNGTLYEAVENPNAASADAADAYLFVTQPLTALFVSFEDGNSLNENLATYNMELFTEDGIVRLAELLIDESAHSYRVRIKFEEKVTQYYFKLSMEEQLFIGHWQSSDDDESELDFFSDGTFSGSIYGEELEGTWHPKFEAQDDGAGSAFKTLICYYFDERLYTDSAEIFLSHDYTLIIDDIAAVNYDEYNQAIRELVKEKSAESITMSANIHGKDMIFQKTPNSN